MKQKKEKRVFVLDTNILINNPESLLHYLQFGDVYLHTVVIEELDGLKKRKPQAQEASRIIDEILRDTNGDFLQNGAVVDGYVGKLFIADRKFSRDLKGKGYRDDSNDNKIINLSYLLSKQKVNIQDYKVKLITEDLNVRIKAKSLGVLAEPAKHLSASKEILSYKGWVRVENEDMQIFTQNRDFVSQEMVEKYQAKQNQYFIVSDQIFYKFDGRKFLLRKRKQGVFGIKPRNIEQVIFFDALFDKDIKLLTVSGIAGTGKTLLALAAGLEGLSKKDYESVYVSRREIGVAGEDHGFLPGNEKDKIAPFMAPFTDSLKVIGKSQKGQGNKLQKLVKEGEKFPFETFSVIYLRGRTISYTFMIIDEAQNLTPAQVKTLITRAGEGTKVLLLGDIHQIDVAEKYLRHDMNGISYVMKKLQGKSRLYHHIVLEQVERSELARLGTIL